MDRLDPAAFRAELLNAPWMVAEMDRRAVKAFEFAEAAAPVDTGEYKRSFFVRSGTNGGVNNDRAFAELDNTAPDAVFVEYGNGKADGQHIMHRAMDAMR